jgi:hypothetical protein
VIVRIVDVGNVPPGEFIMNEGIKREVQRRPIYEFRCDERLKAEV